jgi:hypothetical protein
MKVTGKMSAMPAALKCSSAIHSACSATVGGFCEASSAVDYHARRRERLRADGRDGPVRGFSRLFIRRIGADGQARRLYRLM